MVLQAEVRALHVLGRRKKARTLARKKISEMESTIPRSILRSYLVRIDVLAGDTTRARRHLSELRDLSFSPEERQRFAFLYAMAYATLGDLDAAYAEYRKQSDWWWPATVGFRYPIFPNAQRTLRRDPRYEEVIREANRYWGLDPDGSIPENIDVSTSLADR